MQLFSFFLLWIVFHGVVVAHDPACLPPVRNRAYATVLVGGADNLLRVRVLGASLRRFQVEEDMIVVIPAALATHSTTALLKSDGFKVHVVPSSNTKHINTHDLRSILPLWCFSLTSYDRIVYLDPYSIVQHSLRSSFACDGYCASLQSPNGPIILTPSKDTYLYLLKEVQHGERHISEALANFYNLAACPKYTEPEDSISAPICTEPRTSLATCHILPIEYGAESSNYTPVSLTHDLVCATCGLASPRVITYNPNDHPWESLLYTIKPIQWRWYHVRNSIPMSYDESKFAVVVFLIPVVLILLCLRLHRRIRSKGSVIDSPIDLSSSLMVNLIFIVIAFMTTSLWYHVAISISRYITLFTWPPIYSSIVGSMWMIYGLMIGMMLCDYWNSSLVNGKLQSVLEVSVFLLLLFGLRHFLPGSTLFIPLGLILTNMLLSTHYIKYKSSLRPIVKKEHLSWMFLCSFVYAVAHVILCLVECPEAMRSVLMRVFAMSHAIAMVLLYTQIICGERLQVLSGHVSSLICFSDKRESCGPIQLFRYVLNFTKVNSNINMSCTLFYIMLLLLAVQTGISLCSFYYPTIMPYVCFVQKNRYLSPGIGLSNMCGAREVAEIKLTDEYYEAYSQFTRCMQWTRPEKKSKELVPQYMTILRSLNDECTPDTEFTFTVMRKYAPWRTGFCIYNSRYGKFLSSKTSPQDLCRETEMWRAMPSHTWTFIWSKLSLLLWPLRYSFSYFHPLVSFAMMTLAGGALYKAPIRSPGYRAALLILTSLWAVYLLHISIVSIFYGFPSYHTYTLTISNFVQSVLNRIGVMTGPKFLKLISTSPDQCPETINLLAHVTFLICPLLFIIMLCDIIDNVTFASNKRAEEREAMQITRSPSQLMLENRRRDDQVQDAVAAIAQLTSCAIGAVSLQAIVTLAIPVYNILSPTCHLYEDRFRLISFQFEYLENVVLFANMLCVNSVRFQHSRVSPIMGFAVFAVTYVMIWLLMDTSYALFLRGLVYVYLSWTFITPRVLPLVRIVLSDPRVVSKEGENGHSYELVNIAEEET